MMWNPQITIIGVTHSMFAFLMLIRGFVFFHGKFNTNKSLALI